MRKTFALGIVMLALVMLSASMPVVKAVAYYWDGIQFVEGIYIKYPHPDRDYYAISPYSDWSKKGDELYHTQFNHDKSLAIVGSIAVVATTIGAAIGAKIGGTYGAVVGAVVGGTLGVILSWYASILFLDEHDCIWWWIGNVFMDWLIVNQVWLGIMCIINPSGAQSTISEKFVENGYFRVGAVTVANHIRLEDPYPCHLTISAVSGGTTDPAPGSYGHHLGEEVEVTATPQGDYVFYRWVLDGATNYDNPITITMNAVADHSLKAIFRDRFYLSIIVAGTSSPKKGTTTPSPGTHEYLPGAEVTVTAIPYTGYYFRLWTLNGPADSGNPITVTMDADYTLTVYFGVQGGGSGHWYPKQNGTSAK